MNSDDLRRWMRLVLAESVDYSDYGYWVTPTGQALVVPDSSHYKVLLRAYTGDARIGQDQYGGVIAEGWCWVAVSGNFLCFLDPSKVARPAAATLIQIIQQYADFEDFRFVFTGAGEHVGHEKHDFDNARAAKAFVRGLLASP